MSKTSKRIKKRRHPIVRKMDAMSRVLDPYANILLWVILPLLVIGAGWWEEGTKGAIRGMRVVFFGGLGGLICHRVNLIIMDLVNGYFDRKAAIHTVIQLLAITIGLFAFENQMETNIKIALVGFSFIALIAVVTHIGSLFSK